MTTLTTVYLVLLVLLLVFVYIRALKSRKNNDEFENDESIDNNNETMNETTLNNNQEEKGADVARTRNIMIDVLTRLGCQPVALESGEVKVSYQGEYFMIHFGGPYAQIWDLAWTSVRVDDPELDNVKEAINSVNYSFGPTIIFTNPDREGNILIHTRTDLLIIPDMSDIEEYVREMFDLFFKKKEALYNECHQRIAKQQQQQQQQQSTRRPVGFQPASSPNNENNE